MYLLKFILFLGLIVLNVPTLAAQDATDKKFELDTSANQGVKPYTHPGVVSNKAGRWIGTDNLYNLTTDIRVVVETIKPAGVTLPITAEQIRGKAETQFRGQGLNPYVADATTVLPFLHIQILVYPIEGGFAASLDVRLMEAVTIARMTAEAGAVWQAITWEKQNLIIAKSADFATQLQAAVDESVDAFLKRYKFYEKLKSYLKK